MTRRVLLATGLVALAVAPPRAQHLPQHADTVVRYEIQVSLDPTLKRLTGRQRLTWRNPSDDSVNDLWFHLYLNAFKNNRSTFFKESGGQLRDDEMEQDGWGWIDVTSLKLADGADLTSAMRFEHPDDNNVEDQTVMRVALPSPVPPGGSITLDVTFEAQLPVVFARTGYKRDFYLVAQWYPKLGVYEPAGMRGRTAGGWNCHQFHANSEFYADYGEFVVDFTVPSHFVVGATGIRTARTDHGNGSTTYRYEQADIHDFAWTADPNFVEVKSTFSAIEDVSAEEYASVAALVDRPPEEVQLSDVQITVLMQPSRMPQVERYIDSAKLAIKYFGLWYGRYPYATLTVVDPAPDAGGAGGMEYPTFITAGSSVLLNRGPLAGILAPEQVTIHEFGHQFWYGLVASNEFEEAWLDEGINSYSTGRIVDRAYGADRSVINTPLLKLGEVEFARLQNGPNMKFDAILQPSWKYATSYGFYSYQKPELALGTLERTLGETTMARIMRTYHERWRYKHPSSDDFFATASEVAGRDLSWFFDAVVRGTNVLDYAVGEMSSDEVRPTDGVTGDGSNRQVLKREAAQDSSKGATFATRFQVRRRGEVVMPVEIAFKFEGTPEERANWDGVDRWKAFEFTRAQRLEWVRVDPDRKVLLDVDWLNNDKRSRADTRVAAKWSARFLFWLQNLLASLV